MSEHALLARTAALVLCVAAGVQPAAREALWRADPEQLLFAYRRRDGQFCGHLACIKAGSMVGKHMAQFCPYCWPRRAGACSKWSRTAMRELMMCAAAGMFRGQVVALEAKVLRGR